MIPLDCFLYKLLHSISREIEMFSQGSTFCYVREIFFFFFRSYIVKVGMSLKYWKHIMFTIFLLILWIFSNNDFASFFSKC